MTSQEEHGVEICPDNHRCENGSVCVEQKNAEGKFFCDCEESMLGGASVFSGLYCQHEATVYCTITGKVSKITFCTNSGTCRGNVDDHEEHLGCDCPRGYTGRHCQFIEGSEGPEGFTQNTQTTTALSQSDTQTDRGGDGTGLGTAGVVIIILVVLTLLGALLAFVFRRHRQLKASHVIDSSKSADGNLHEADGSILAVPTQTRTFESDGDNNDDLQISAVDSGHLA